LLKHVNWRAPDGHGEVVAAPSDPSPETAEELMERQQVERRQDRAEGWTTADAPDDASVHVIEVPEPVGQVFRDATLFELLDGAARDDRLVALDDVDPDDRVVGLLLGLLVDLEVQTLDRGPALDGAEFIRKGGLDVPTDSAFDHADNHGVLWLWQQETTLSALLVLDVHRLTGTRPTTSAKFRAELPRDALLVHPGGAELVTELGVPPASDARALDHVH
jgi:hypothetical protein